MLELFTSLEAHAFENRMISKKIAEVIRGDNQAILVVSALWGTTDRLYRAARDPGYASRLVQDLSKQHLRFAPGLDSSKNAHLFSMVLHNLKEALSMLAQDPQDQSAREQPPCLRGASECTCRRTPFARIWIRCISAWS